MRTNIYYTEYERNGKIYRIEIYPAAVGGAAHTTLVKFDNSALMNFPEHDVAYPTKLPVGMCENAEFDLEIDLIMLSEHPELIQYLRRPLHPGAASVVAGSTSSYTKSVDLHNVILLKEKIEDSWNTYMVGFQRPIEGNKLSIEADSVPYRISVEGAAKVILESIKAPDILPRVLFGCDSGIYNYFPHQQAIDLIWDYPTGDTLLPNEATYTRAALEQLLINDLPASVLFIPLEVIDRSVNYYANNILWEHLPGFGGDAGFDLSGDLMPGARFRAQDPTSPNRQPGQYLNYDELYIIAGVHQHGAIRPIDEYLAGFLVDSNDSANIYDYDNMWDYYKWLTGAYLTKVRIRYSTTAPDNFRITFLFNKIWETPLKTTNLKGNLGKNNFEEGYETKGAARVNLTGMHDKDIDEVNYPEKGYLPRSLSQERLETRPPFHNLPSNPSLDDIEFSTNNKCFLFNHGFKCNKLYSAINNIDLDGNTMFYPVKVHDCVELNTGISTYEPSHNALTMYTDAMPSNDLTNYIRDLTGETGSPTANFYSWAIVQIQARANIGKAWTRIIAELFSNPDQMLYAKKSDTEKYNIGECVYVDMSLDTHPLSAHIDELNYFGSIQRKGIITGVSQDDNGFYEYKIFILGE